MVDDQAGWGGHLQHLLKTFFRRGLLSIEGRDKKGIRGKGTLQSQPFWIFQAPLITTIDSILCLKNASHKLNSSGILDARIILYTCTSEPRLL